MTSFPVDYSVYLVVKFEIAISVIVSEMPKISCYGEVEPATKDMNDSPRHKRYGISLKNNLTQTKTRLV